MIRASTLLCIFLYVGGVEAQKTDSGRTECPTQLHLGKDLWQYRGQYRNGAYGYAAHVPDGLVGVDEKNPFYQKGFAILSLGGGYLSVDAEVNNLFKAPGEAAKENVSELKSEFGPLSSVSFRQLRLASYPAVQSTAVFHCPDGEETYTDISVFVLNPGKRFVYNITWQGPVSGEAEGMKTMQAIEQSWKFITPR